MAKPIEPTPILEGKAAEEFVAEMRRIESLPKDSPEYKSRLAFFDNCRKMGKVIQIIR
jgi:hypothetical protein